MALPKRNVTDTNPSDAGYTKRSGMPPKYTPPASRFAGEAPQASESTVACVAIMAAVCTETSTCWPRPSRARPVCAMRAPAAASAAACRYACGTATATGARSASPFSNNVPDAARHVRSAAAQPALGPRCPNGVIDTMTRAGLTFESAA